MRKPKKSFVTKKLLTLLVLIFIIATIIVIASYSYFVSSSSTNSSTSSATPQATTTPVFTPYNATFQIVINGETRTFSDPRYHNKSEDVYIAPEGSAQVQVTVAKPNITWGDFFKTLPMSVTSDCIITGTNQTFCTNASRKLRFYIDSIENPNALNATITPNSQLKIAY